jgi:hypothetical protein
LTRQAVRIPHNLERDIIANVDEVLRLVRGGNHYLVFSDILKTFNDLCVELGQ